MEAGGVAIGPEVKREHVPLQWRSGYKLHYAAGVDVGKRHDPSALAIVERRQLMAPDGRHSNRPIENGDPVYHVVHAQRFPLHEPYPLQGQRLARLLSSREELAGCEVLIDRTGVGDGVIDQWKRDIPEIRPIVLTAGREVVRAGRELHISKSVLIQELQGHLHYQTIKVPKDLPEAEAIAREAADFEVHYSASGALQWNAKSGAHDDLIVAIALALFGASHVAGRGHITMVPTLGF